MPGMRGRPEITHLIDYEEFCGYRPRQQSRAAGEEWDIEPREVTTPAENKEAIQLVDVRDPVELQISSLPGAVLLP
jgi:adenylyltransferase/sulfurtransferase